MKGKRSFGTIQKLPSGRWRARYADPEGRLTTTSSGRAATVMHSAPTTFDTKGDAEAWLVDERRLISSGNWTSPAARIEEARRAEETARLSTFGPYAIAWMDGRHDLRPTTRASYNTALSKHLVPAFGKTPLAEITPAAVRAWFASFGDRTPTARAHAYALLKQILDTAVEDEIIARNPCRVKAGGRTRPSREPEVLTLAELFALADEMPAKHRALTLLSGFCGLRFGEAVALRRRDVDLERGTVTVTRTAVRAGGTKSTNAPKTNAGKRTVALPQIVVDALRDHLRDVPITGGRNSLVFPGADGGLLAPTALYGRAPRTERRGSKTYTKRGYGFYAAREAIGHPALHWHDLRRTAATLGAQSGATVREMQARLGHTTPTMALHYQAASAERDRAIADRLQQQVDAYQKM